MPRPVKVLRPPSGPRVYVLGLRLHHGLSGALLVSMGLIRRDRRLVGAGLAMVVHDRADYRIWLKVERCPA